MSTTDLHAPQFSESEAREIFHRLFDKRELSSIRKLPSYDDQNWLIRNSQDEQFILKIQNANDTRDILDFQNRVFELLNDSNVLAPAVCPDSESRQVFEEVHEATGRRHLARCLTFIPGEVVGRSDHFKLDWRALGEFLGKMDRELSQFQHPAMHRPDHDWDLENCLPVIDTKLKIPDLLSPKDGDLVVQFRDKFRDQFSGRISGLRRQVVQNDANDFNLIVTDDGGFGIIDFGDLMNTRTIYNLAICVGYHMMLPVAGQTSQSTLAFCAPLVSGYHRQYPLTPQEIGLIFPLACMRLCVSVTMSAFALLKDPTNEYLRAHATPAWNCLRRLENLDFQHAEKAMREACGLDKES